MFALDVMYVQGSVSRVDNELKPFITNWHDVIQLKKTNSVPILISRLLSIVIYEVHSKRSGQWKILKSVSKSNIVPWRHLFCEDLFCQRKAPLQTSSHPWIQKGISWMPTTCLLTDVHKLNKIWAGPGGSQVTKLEHVLGDRTYVGRAAGPGLGMGGSQADEFEHSGGSLVTCDCPMASQAVVSLRLPLWTDRQTRLKTLPSYNFLGRR